MIRRLSPYLLSLSATFLVFELFVWFFVPRTITGSWELYRKPADLPVAGYTPGYFVAHESRGFEIQPNQRGKHYVHEIGAYDIWSNELGCYDHPYEPSDYANGFIYMAGDSFTWGYAEFFGHFAEQLETKINEPIMRCGVTNTGQRHQFEKFLEVAKKIGRWPRMVLVNYVANDMADDYAYPTSTVVDGWIVPKVELADDNAIIELSAAEIESRMTSALKKPESTFIRDLKTTLYRYSAVSNLLRQIVHRTDTADKVAPATDANNKPSGRRGYGQLNKDREYYPWDVIELSLPNRQALMTWQEHANANGYQLVVSLLGYQNTQDIENYFSMMREDLKASGLDVLDASPALAAHPAPLDLYLPIDGHFSAAGHAFYADFLAGTLKERGLLKQ